MLWSQFSPIFAIFSAKNLAFFSKTNVMIKFLQKLAVLWAKNANIFAKLFGENIFKIITTVLGEKARQKLLGNRLHTQWSFLLINFDRIHVINSQPFDSIDHSIDLGAKRTRIMFISILWIFILFDFPITFQRFVFMTKFNELTRFFLITANLSKSFRTFSVFLAFKKSFSAFFISF
jgi:hypothetical protein